MSSFVPAKPSSNGSKSTIIVPASPAATPRAERQDYASLVRKGRLSDPRKIVVYGTGGSGKTSLIEALQRMGKKPLIIDLDNGSKHLDVARIGLSKISTFEDLRAILQDGEFWKAGGYDTVVIDSLTKAEEMAANYVVRTVPHEKGKPIKTIEDYGFGKGYQIVFDCFNQLMQDCDWHTDPERGNRNIVLICHECTAPVLNASGDDYECYQPRLQSPKSGMGSTRSRIKEWADVIAFIGYDIFADKEGKVTGSGSRMVYFSEDDLWHWGKGRPNHDPVAYTPESGEEIWNIMLNMEKA